MTAVYVSDMGKGQVWQEPGVDNWMKADAAVYVIESRKRGGMEMPEAVPFADRKAADAFVAETGARLSR